MWSDIVKKKPNNINKQKSKKTNIISSDVNDTDNYIDYFDIQYFGEFETCISPLLDRIKFGPVFKLGTTYDIIEYVKDNCYINNIDNFFDQKYFLDEEL